MPEEPIRPNPDILLEQIQKKDAQESQGKLTIFMGMVAGVGKTYAMLVAAKNLLENGCDVVVGIVETHKRHDTETQLEGLTIIPRKEISYKGVVTTEMDLDAIIERRPQLVLVDELAHTNAPGSRHTKRYLDILELLEHGIDVFTTVNIQHIESRASTVHDITGIAIKETVPDSFVDTASDIILIDLTPEALLKRLDEGKIYPSERAIVAKQNFFQLGNITALRDLALHAVTERADKDVRNFQQLNNVEKPWKNAHRLGVSIFPNPKSEAMIRWTRRLADSLNASWVAISVSSQTPFSETEKQYLIQHMSLVEQLGGEIVTIENEDLIQGILVAAKNHQVTQLVVSTVASNRFLDWIPGFSFSDRLMRKCTDIDIYRVSSEPEPFWPLKLKLELKPFIPPHLHEWVTLLVTVGGCWGLASFLHFFLGYISVGFIFLLAVSISGLFLSRFMILIQAFIFTLLHDFFFIPPLYSLAVRRPEDLMILFMFLSTAATVGHLTHRLKTKEFLVHSQEEKTNRMFEFSKMLSSTHSVSEISEQSLGFLEKITKAPICLYIKDHDSDLLVTKSEAFEFPENEQAVAQWVFFNRKSAGKFTDTLSASSAFYTPLINKDTVWGVLGISVKRKSDLSTENIALIKTSAYQIASALEREFAHAKSSSLEVLKETQKLYKTLLDAVSRELKTPLATLRSAISRLLDGAHPVDPEQSKILIKKSDMACSRLQDVVQNLLDMTRVESGDLMPVLDVCATEDLIKAVLELHRKTLKSREVTVTVRPNASAVRCDPLLTTRLLSNLISNIEHHTPERAPFEITATADGIFVKIEVRDFGNGLPTEHTDRIFEKFYRVHPEKSEGSGLGLSVSQRFADVQNGRLMAHNHPKKGAVFALFLPRADR